MTELKLTEQFRLDFAQLKRACNGSPQALLSFFGERPDFKELSWNLDGSAGRVEKAGAYRKMHSQVATEFIADWREFNSKWRLPVAYVVASDLRIGLEDEWGPMPSFDEWVGYRSDPYERETPDANHEDEFVPEAHNGRSAVSAFLQLAGDRAHDRRVNGDEPEFVANTYLVGIGALEYFERVIGISIGEAFDRWNALPPVFVPQHVSDQHGLTAKAGLYALFNECVRAWVAGAPFASAAMCRALLELVLKQHYLRDHKKRENLANLIDISVERYSFLDGERMHALRENANAMLHDFAASGGSMEIDDARMLAIFRDLKHYIEEAPQS
jgi:hypothetical protein